MAEKSVVLTIAQMEKMSPQERADAVDAATVRSWDEVPESFRSEINAVASRLGEERRKRA